MEGRWCNVIALVIARMHQWGGGGGGGQAHTQHRLLEYDLQRGEGDPTHRSHSAEFGLDRGWSKCTKDGEDGDEDDGQGWPFTSILKAHHQQDEEQ